MIRPDGTVDDRIVTTVTPADRIPSIGRQLPAFGADPCCPRCGSTDAEHIPCGRVLSNGQYRPAIPERLTLWDQPAELWSTDR